MSARPFLKQMVPPQWRRRMREYVVSLNVTHLYGPERIRLSRNDAVVTCVVKNGEFYIEPFIKYYSQMGFRHIFFLDNGSSDQTISIARRHNNVSICQSTLPIDTYQGLFKKYLAHKSAQGGWCLDADIDEFFDFPFSGAITFHDFLEYLNGKQYTAVMTQLLDMFSDKPLSRLIKHGDNNLRSVYEYYDISDLTKIKYRASKLVASYGSGNQVSNASAALYFGGIRKTLYGNDCLLTKHSLFMPGKRLDLFPHVHFVNHAKMADISCVMLHYKLTANALDVAQQNKERFVGNSETYGRFIDLLLSKPDYQIKRDTALKLRTVDELVESGFLFVSQEYRNFLRTSFSRCGDPSPGTLLDVGTKVRHERGL